MRRKILVFLVALMVTSVVLPNGSFAGRLTEARTKYAGQTINILMSAGLQTEPVVKLKGWFEKITGIKVNIEVYDETTTREKAMLDYTAHTGYYDALMVQDYFFDEFYQGRWFEPLDKYIETMADPEWLDLDDLPQTSLSYFTRDGKLWVLPFTFLRGVFFYNKDVFDKYGFSVPQTFTDMEMILAKLKVSEPKIYGYGARASKTFDAFGSSIGTAWAYGGRILDDNFNVKCNTPEMIAGISEFVFLLQKYGAPGQAAMSWPETLPLFMDGKIAMMIEVSHCGGSFENPEHSRIAGRVGYALPPKGPAGNHAQWTYTDGFALNKDSKHKGATWLFMQWRSSKQENMREVTDHLRYDVTSRAVFTSPEYHNVMRELGIQEYGKILEMSHEVATTRHLPRVPEFVEIAEAFQANISLAVAGEITAQKAMQNAQKAIYDIMKRAGYYD